MSMKKQHAIFVAILFSTMCYAETATLKLTYENLDFDNSVKKDKGQKYGLELAIEWKRIFIRSPMKKQILKPLNHR